MARVLAALTAGLAIACCGSRPTAANLSWNLVPTPPAVGPATLTVTLHNPAGQPMTGAAVRVEGHMSHPGMTPVGAAAAERAPGVYAASFAFTMRGDWVLLVSVAMPDGGRIEQRIDVGNVR